MEEEGPQQRRNHPEQTQGGEQQTGACASLFAALRVRRAHAILSAGLE